MGVLPRLRGSGRGSCGNDGRRAALPQPPLRTRLMSWAAARDGKSRSPTAMPRTGRSTGHCGSEHLPVTDGRQPGTWSSTRTGAKMHLSSDFSELLSLLARHRVRYVVVGGYAVVHHAEPRYTKDLDLFVEATAENAKRLKRALEEFAGPLPELTVEDLADPTRVIMNRLLATPLPEMRTSLARRAARTSSWRPTAHNDFWATRRRLARGSHGSGIRVLDDLSRVEVDVVARGRVVHSQQARCVAGYTADTRRPCMTAFTASPR